MPAVVSFVVSQVLPFLAFPLIYVGSIFTVSSHFVPPPPVIHTRTVSASVLASTQMASPSATLSPSPSPLPTETVTPVPPVLSGYCIDVPVLFYHHIQPEAQAQSKGQSSLTVDTERFDTQMAYLASQGYNTISVESIANALHTHTQLPAKSIAITFDDGYKDNYEYAFPILRKYNLHGNLMLSTGLVGGADYLSWQQVEDMAHSGLWYFSDHTWSHYAVNHGTDEKLHFEIETARKQLQDHTGQTINTFTYPYGSTSQQAINILQQDGFTAAFTTAPGRMQCDSAIFLLPRIRIGNSPLNYYGL